LAERPGSNTPGMDLTCGHADSMDALSEILRSIKPQSARAGVMRLSEPWGFSTPKGGELVGPTTVVYGNAVGEPCWVTLPERDTVLRLDPGDVILISCEHTLQSALDVPTVNIVELLWQSGLKANPQFNLHDEPNKPQHVRWGGSGCETRLLGFTFGQDRDFRLGNPLLRSLPPYILVRKDSSRQFPWIHAAIDFLASEPAESPGFTATVLPLSELVLVSIVRSHLLNEPDVTRGWLRGLTDPGIARALQAIHERPSAPWTVRALAEVAGRSRTSFAIRFAELVENAPIDYLNQWRMHLAAEQLLASRVNLAKLGSELGYASDTAFRNAFKRRYGVVPSRFRGTQAGVSAERNS
jgi:AraC-like DNA-binding protein